MAAPAVRTRFGCDPVLLSAGDGSQLTFGPSRRGCHSTIPQGLPVDGRRRRFELSPPQGRRSAAHLIAPDRPRTGTWADPSEVPPAGRLLPRSWRRRRSPSRDGEPGRPTRTPRRRRQVSGPGRTLSLIHISEPTRLL